LTDILELNFEHDLSMTGKVAAISW